jgi:hypothetical protein
VIGLRDFICRRNKEIISRADGSQEHEDQDWQRFIKPPYVPFGGRVSWLKQIIVKYYVTYIFSFQAPAKTKIFQAIEQPPSVFNPNQHLSPSTQPIVATPKPSHAYGHPFSKYYDHKPWVPMPPSTSTNKIEQKVKSAPRPHKTRYSNIFPTKKLLFPFRNSLERSSIQKGRRQWVPAKRKPKLSKTVQVALPNLSQTQTITHSHRQRKPQVRRQDNALAEVPKEGLASLFALSVIGSLLAL